VNKQFEMIGTQVRFEDIPEHGIVTYKDGKKDKKDYWYNIYKFTEEQEKEWKEWAVKELRKMCEDEKVVKEAFRQLEMLYGFVIRYTKKGELF